MKLSIISDIHFGPERYHQGVLRKMGKQAPVFLNKFVVEMNRAKPTFVVVLGDLIEDDCEVSDEKNITQIMKSLTKLECPVHYVAGNHDIQNIPEDKFVKLLDQDSLYYSFDQDNYHGIVLFAKSINHENAVVTEEQMTWLKHDLDKTKKKTIVFSHYALADQDLTGNYWYEGLPEACLVVNRKRVRDIFEQSKKVIGVFNGHLHWDKKHVHNNIPYFTIQSLIENENNQGAASEAHAVVDVTEDKINVGIRGNYPKKFLYPD